MNDIVLYVCPHQYIPTNSPLGYRYKAQKPKYPKSQNQKKKKKRENEKENDDDDDIDDVSRPDPSVLNIKQSVPMSKGGGRKLR